MSQYLFTSESVSEGHPDKLADQISDAVLDNLISQDASSRVAVETLLTNGLVVVAGEVTTEAYSDIASIVRDKILAVGYNDGSIGFDGASCGVTIALSQQSPEIASGVFNALESRSGAVKDKFDLLGAGDQGIMFGYAVNDNTDYFPVAGKLSHLITNRHAWLRKNDVSSLLLPDAKSQVTIKYVDNIPVSVENILVSTQHKKGTSLKEVEGYVINELIKPVLSEYINEYHFGELNIDNINYLINPAGEWNVGGPRSDAGLTGRKIIVDTYGGSARHGGGAFSGKDPSKVDRSGAYALRWVAKNIVAAGLAQEIEIQVAYAIGSAHPVSINVDTKGKPSVGKNVLEGIVNEVFDLRPAAIIEQLGLKKFNQYSETAKNGHFGSSILSFPWEETSVVDALQEYL